MLSFENSKVSSSKTCNSQLYAGQDWKDLDVNDISNLYDKALSFIMEKHAPLNRETLVVRPVQP